MIDRLTNMLKNNSFFLFGARGTGKSTLLRRNFSDQDVIWIDLLDPAEEDLFVRSPNELARRLDASPAASWVVIDEVQKAPKLLNIVHRRIESHGTKFALTGSSARRLKQKGVNLLAGRAFTNYLFPLTSRELGDRFDLREVLEWGTLPQIYSLADHEEKAEYLRSYALNYLSLEIQAEQWVRKMEPFRRALPIISQMNGKIINYSKIARDVGVDTTTVQNYYEILEDTLVGFRLEAFHQSIRKRQSKSPKFYLFDAGVKRALDRTLNVSLNEGTYAFGDAFEHFVICELIRFNEYYKCDFGFSYLRTKDDAEIDVIIDRPGMPNALIEIKSVDQIDESHVRAVKAMSKSFDNVQAYCLSRDPNRKVIDGVEVLPWRSAFAELGFPIAGSPG